LLDDAGGDPADTGQLGKQDICQVAVSLSIANDHVAYQPYLSQSWTNDDERRTKAACPKVCNSDQTTDLVGSDQVGRRGVAARCRCQRRLRRGALRHLRRCVSDRPSSPLLQLREGRK
jgi:hypothetical protein